MSEPESVTISTPGHKPMTLTAEQFAKLPERLGVEREAPIVSKALEAAGDLLAQHWYRISQIRDKSEDASVAVSLSFTVDCSGPLPKIVTKIAYAEKFKDEREDTLPDAKQPGLGLDEPTGE